MKKIVRDIPASSAHDLLIRVPRASLTYASEQGPQAHPITFVWRNQRYWVGIADTVQPQPSANQEVVLLIDEGIYFFDLRAIYVRGQVVPAQPPAGTLRGYLWHEVMPSKVVAWDYGTLHEVDDEHQ